MSSFIGIGWENNILHNDSKGFQYVITVQVLIKQTIQGHMMNKSIEQQMLNRTMLAGLPAIVFIASIDKVATCSFLHTKRKHGHELISMK